MVRPIDPKAKNIYTIKVLKTKASDIFIGLKMTKPFKKVYGIRLVDGSILHPSKKGEWVEFT